MQAWHNCFRSLDALTADPAATLTSPVIIINVQMDRISLADIEFLF